MTPLAFEYLSPLSRIVYGGGAIRRTGEEAAALGARRALVICGRHVGASPLLEAVTRSLGDTCAAVFSEVPPHSSVDTVEAVTMQARELGADVLVALGGGSSSDTAKAVAILLAEGGRLPDHATRFSPPDRLVRPSMPHQKLPIISIPTTLSGAEFTPGLGIRDSEGHKLLFWDLKLASRVVILDPDAVTATPWNLFAPTAFNALAHCLEGLYSRQRQPVSDALALGGLQALDRGLKTAAAAPSSPEARGELLVGSALAGMVIINARVGIHHAICHGLGARGGLHHGVANAIMLPHTLRYNAEVAGSRLALAAAALGLPAKPEALIARIQELQAVAGVPRRLRDTGMTRTVLPDIARDTLADRGTYFNPKPTLSQEPILSILAAAW